MQSKSSNKKWHKKSKISKNIQSEILNREQENEDVQFHVLCDFMIQEKIQEQSTSNPLETGLYTF